MRVKNLATSDICDQFDEKVSILPYSFQSFGKRESFSGLIETVKTYHDNSFVKKLVSEPGKGRVLLVDGGSSLQRALLGGNLAKLAQDNGWSGIVILGAIRDAAEINALDIGVKALGTCPRKSLKQDQGAVGATLQLGGITITPGLALAADLDGVVVGSKGILSA